MPFYEWFYNVILTSANSVPIQSLWVAFFANPVDLNRAIQTGLYENGVGYYTLAAGAAVNSGQSGVGALFANSVTIPGDGMNVSKLGPDGCGLIKGNVSGGRKDMEPLTISFLDTNMSFCDYNLRPWTIYANHKSLKDPDVKTTITIIQFAKSGEGKSLIPRAIWTFHDACPVSIASEQWNWGADNVVSRQVDFAYNYYLLNSDPAITAIKTVDSIVSNTGLNHTSQPVTVPTGGLGGHGGSNNVSISRDTPSPTSHPQGEIVTLPKDDIVARGLNIGLDILNGNSNVTIESHDAIDRLKTQAEEIQNRIILANDVPQRDTGQTQKGHEPKEPTGPKQDTLDHITRPNDIEREHDETVGAGFEKRSVDKKPTELPIPNNSKVAAKASSDTPLFFPSDGDENSVKITGRTADGELDTPEVETMEYQQVVIEENGDVGKNIPLKIVNINREDKREGGSVKAQLVNPSSNDFIDEGHTKAQIVIIKDNDVRKDEE